jgi:ABC-type sugar transport system substrate-binding protein
VVFLNPGHPNENTTGRFWPNVSLFMNAAAKDLDIELVTLYANRNHILMKTLAAEIISHQPKYIILVNEKGIASNLIKEISPHKIPIFMLLNHLNNQDLLSLTNVEKSMIKGSIIPNNYIVGKQLINGLIDIYESLPKSIRNTSPKTLLALEGDFTTPAALERERGLSEVIRFNNKIELLDNSVANWSNEQAYRKVRGILKRKRIDIIWAANDAMAFGAKKAVNESQLNYPVVIGGINWDIEDKKFPIDLSFGGHVTLGALALVMINDINNNTLPDNKRHEVIDIFESSLNESFPLFINRLHLEKLDNYDFSKFSRSSKTYLKFTIKNLSKSYKEQ